MNIMTDNYSNNDIIVDKDSSEFSNIKEELTPYRKIKKSLTDHIEKYDNGAVLLFELPSDHYFEMNLASAKILTDMDYKGIYVSFQRPFNNLSNMFEKQNIDINKIKIIDCATAISKETPVDNTNCINISGSMDVDELGKIILSSINDLDSFYKFVIIDSLSTLSLFKNSDEATKFAELLIDNIQNSLSDNIFILFNVAESFSQKDYIKNISIHSDEVINLNLPLKHII